MKKLLLLGLTVCLGANFAQAQDAKAKATLQKVSDKFKSASSIQADFSLSVNDASGKARSTQKGTFYMKGNKYKLDLGAQKIFYDGKSVWTYLPQSKEVQVTSLNLEDQPFSPSKLFSGSYEKDYKYSYAGTKTISGKSVEVIELKPLKKQSFDRIQLYVDKSRSMITGGQMFDRNGGSYSYTISNVNLDAKLSDASFTFNPRQHPGVEVIDLR